MPHLLHRISTCLALLTAASVGRVLGDPAAAAGPPGKTYTGMVISVDPKGRTLWVSGWVLTKKEFNIGDNCTYGLSYTMLNNNTGTANDLRPGERVTVSYQEHRGILIAYHIEQKPMRFTGTVRQIPSGSQTLVLRWRLGTERMAMAPDCIFLLPHDRAGALADLHPGDPVVVTYELPHGKRTAMEITRLR